jgi:hypothetical protein
VVGTIIGSMTCTRTCSAPATTGTLRESGRRSAGSASVRGAEDPTDPNPLYVGASAGCTSRDGKSFQTCATTRRRWACRTSRSSDVIWFSARAADLDPG